MLSAISIGLKDARSAKGWAGGMWCKTVGDNRLACIVFGKTFFYGNIGNADPRRFRGSS
jgi:hypothetical protein